MGRSTYRPELKRFELQSGVQIPPLREAWAHPGHICTGPRWGLLGVVRAAVGADRIHRGHSTAQSGASAAKSEHWHAPLIRLRPLTSPFSCARRHKRTLKWHCCPLHSSRARGGASRLCRTGSRSRLCAVVRSRVRPSSGGTALNKNSSRLHAMLTSKVRRGGRTCKMQHARCSAAVPG